MASLVKLKKVEDGRGVLVIQQSEVPFEIKRTFWIYGKKNIPRGGHGHFKTKLALVAIAGQVAVEILSSEVQKQYILDSPDEVLLINPLEWHTMVFDEESILLVLASSAYDAEDYFYERPILNDSV